MPDDAQAYRLDAIQRALEAGRTAHAHLRAIIGEVDTEIGSTPVPPEERATDEARAALDRFIRQAHLLGVTPSPPLRMGDPSTRVQLAAAVLLDMETELRHALSAADLPTR